MHRKQRLQSAMEYLMTYGWAILIVAVVLASLFQLGVFNSSSFAPRAPPGACQVFRPSGPGTTTNINLIGVCTGQIPQYTAQGTSYSLMYTTNMPLLNQFTFVGWRDVRPPLPGEGGDSVVSSTCGIYTSRSTTSWTARFDLCDCIYTSNSQYVGCYTWATISNLKLATWYLIATTVDLNGNLADYAFYNGQSQSASYAIGQQISTAFTRYYIGAYDGQMPNDALNGSIANVQVYNTSLSANDLQALYLEGIGGAPIKLRNLVAWWPLNGNFKDYSGNGHDIAVVTNTVFKDSWNSVYVVP